MPLFTGLQCIYAVIYIFTYSMLCYLNEDSAIVAWLTMHVHCSIVVEIFRSDLVLTIISMLF